jgi:hypothetical protein
VIAYFDAQAVEFTHGEPAEIEHRSDESGRRLRMNFCSACETTVSHTAEVRRGMRAIAGERLGRISRAAALRVVLIGTLVMMRAVRARTPTLTA